MIRLWTEMVRVVVFESISIDISLFRRRLTITRKVVSIQMMNTKVPTPAEVEDVLGDWDIGTARDITSDALGTINQTWLITSETGRYAVRLSGHLNQSALRRECELLKYVVGQGIPAIEPVLSRAGEPFVVAESGLWIVSPFAPGFQTDRELMTPEQDRGMGRCLGRLMNALSSCPEDLGKRRRIAVDVKRTLSEMKCLETLIRSYPAPEDYEAYALDRLRGRREWIERHASETTDGLSSLAHQVIHGDYQEKNVFFDDRGEVVSLIDWDNAWTAPPEWEIIRTLNFVMDFDAVRGKTFIDGYSETRALDLDALDQAAWAYGVSRTHDLWLFEEIYERGNDRTRRFLLPGPFDPVYDRWIPLREALKEA